MALLWMKFKVKCFRGYLSEKTPTGDLYNNNWRGYIFRGFMDDAVQFYAL